MVHIALQLHGKLDFLICPSYAENNDTPTEMMKPRCAIFGQGLPTALQVRSQPSLPERYLVAGAPGGWPN
jgi:hypothetical protein